MDVTVERYGPGDDVADPRAGDFILIRGSSWVSQIIYAAERRRPRPLRRYAYWSHCALVANRYGAIIDVTNRGVVVRHIGRYRDDEYHYVRVDCPESQRIGAVLFAARAVGQRYDVLSFLRIGWNLVIRRPRISAPDRGQQVCASVVARALAHAGIEFDLPPHEMMAGDLAYRFGVLP
jgi:hypothetical protein